MPQQYSAWVDPRLIPQQDVNTMPNQAMTEEEMLIAQGIDPSSIPQNIPTSIKTTVENRTRSPIQQSGQTDEQRALFDAYKQQQEIAQNLIGQQQTGIDQLQRFTEQYQEQPQRTDLSGLMALADAWGIDKSNFAGSYKRPQTPEERAASIFDLQNKLQERKEDLTKSQYENIKNAIAAIKAGKEKPLADELTRSQIVRNYTEGRKIDLTPGQKAADVSYGKDYQDWNAQGGYANVEKSLSALDEAANQLEQNPELAGNWTSVLPDSVRKRIDEKGFSIQQAVEQAVQQTLRQTLGAQFTEQEGERVLKRAFDPALSGAENARRIRSEADKMRKQAQAKEKASQVFHKTGSIKTLQPNVHKANKSIPTPKSPTPEFKDGDIKEYQGKKYQLTNDNWVEVQ